MALNTTCTIVSSLHQRVIGVSYLDTWWHCPQLGFTKNSRVAPLSIVHSLISWTMSYRVVNFIGTDKVTECKSTSAFAAVADVLFKVCCMGRHWHFQWQYLFCTLEMSGTGKCGYAVSAGAEDVLCQAVRHHQSIVTTVQTEGAQVFLCWQSHHSRICSHRTLVNVIQHLACIFN